MQVTYLTCTDPGTFPDRMGWWATACRAGESGVSAVDFPVPEHFPCYGRENLPGKEIIPCSFRLGEVRGRRVTAGVGLSSEGLAGRLVGASSRGR